MILFIVPFTITALKPNFRISAYAVISTTSSVIYFGGLTENGPTDKVTEYINFQWNPLGKLANPRHQHRAFKIGNAIFLFGGSGTKLVFKFNPLK